MTQLLGLIALTTVLYCAPTLAMPMLSEDGSALTGLNVGGTQYDVMFGDGEGTLGDIFGGVVFDEARRVEANAVSDALFAFFSANPIAGSVLSGCEEDPIGICWLFNPDTFRRPGVYRPSYFDIDFVYFDGASGIVQSGTNTRAVIEFVGYADSGRVTLVTYKVSPVPMPTTSVLLGLALLLLRARYRTGAV